jgi:hypothetical protein
VNRLQNSGRFEVCEHLDDVFGHGWWGWEVVTSGLESVFICHPIDGEDDAIGSGKRIRSFGHGADILRFGSNLFLVAKDNGIKLNLLEGVAAIGVHFAVG